MDIIMEKILVHSKDFSIRWGDMDAYGHMNNTMYFFYTQEARFEFLKDNNIEFSPNTQAPILAGISCKFLRPIFYPAQITVETWLIKIEGKRVFFEHVLKSQEMDKVKKYAILEAVVVWYDFILKKSIKPPRHSLEMFGLLDIDE